MVRDYIDVTTAYGAKLIVADRIREMYGNDPQVLAIDALGFGNIVRVMVEAESGAAVSKYIKNIRGIKQVERVLVDHVIG